MDFSTPPPNFSGDPADVQTSVAASVDSTVLTSDDNPVRPTASVKNLSITPTASLVSSTRAATLGEVDVASSCSSGSFPSSPPGPSKPWTAESLSHDDTSWASPSEVSLAFGAKFVNPRPVRILRSPLLRVDLRIPTETYSHPPPSGHLKPRFNRTLLPLISIPKDGVPLAVPLIKLQHLEDIIAFRQRSSLIIQEVLASSYSDVDVGSVEETPSGRHGTVNLPPIVDRIRPVLYQAVSTGWGSGVILEAKDFFTVGPDRRDLQCIIFDQHTINVVSS
ncbi:hypothetical protein RB195_017485 [Necator americanus]|uniref:Uncharacterized protein n=1 Tax=Necator americanus TaxID=51031 RepID=A0ABR1C5F7_NECAM